MRPSGIKTAGRSGLFLVQTMIMTMLLALAAALMLRMAFGRRVAVARANSSETMRQLGLAAQSQAAACLQAADYAQDGCDFGAAAACLPGGLRDGRGVFHELSWEAVGPDAAGDCAFRAVVHD